MVSSLMNYAYIMFYRYKIYKRMVTICRRKCKAEMAGSSAIFAEDIEDLHFYERKVKETLCLMKCNQDYREIAGAGALKQLPYATEKKFVDLSIYEYLHICYFQVQKYYLFDRTTLSNQTSQIFHILTINY